MLFAHEEWEDEEENEDEIVFKKQEDYEKDYLENTVAYKIARNLCDDKFKARVFKGCNLVKKSNGDEKIYFEKLRENLFQAITAIEKGIKWGLLDDLKGEIEDGEN